MFQADNLKWLSLKCVCLIYLETYKNINYIHFCSFRNRQRKLGTKLQWSAEHFVKPPCRPTLCTHKHTHTDRHSHTLTQTEAKSTTKTHWRIIIFWTDLAAKNVGGGKKLKKKNIHQVEKEIPDLTPEPTAWARPSTRLPLLYSLPKKLFSACKTVQEAYYLMID